MILAERKVEFTGSRLHFSINFGSARVIWGDCKERCRSGRSGRSRKPLYPFGYRGFESLSFRKKHWKIDIFQNQRLTSHSRIVSNSEVFCRAAKTKLSSIRTSKSSKIIGVQSEQKFRLCCNPAMKKGGLVDKKGGGILAWTNIPTPESRPAGKQPKNNF